VTLLLGAWPVEALADDAAQARFHDELARRHYARGRFEEAVREFFLEQRVAPNPRVVFNIALCFEQLHRDEDAFLAFSEYLASGDADPERHRTAEETLAEVAPRVARVRVETDPPGAQIFVDQVEHGDYGQSPRLLAVPAGERRVRAELAGHRPAEAVVTATVGTEIVTRLTLAPIVGTLRVQSTPEGHVQIRSPEGTMVKEGDTPFEATLPPGPYTFQVAAAGHRPARSATSVSADRAIEESVTLEALPPPRGEITVTSNVSGAVVTLDGDEVGFTPVVLPDIRAGAHRVAVNREGLRPWSGAVRVTEDERAFLTVTLEEPGARRRSPLSWLVGGGGVVALSAGLVVGGFALDTHASFDDAIAGGNGDRAAALRSRGEVLNVIADALLVAGGASLAAGVTLYLVSGAGPDRESAATIARGER